MRDVIAAEFPGAAGYLNTASIGLPPQRTVDAMRSAIDDWQYGRVHAPDYDADVDQARKVFARLVSAPLESVAIGALVSPLIGHVAAALEPGSRVVAPEGEFTSVIFPFLTRADIEMVTVPLGRLADSITPDIDLVAFSVVQSSDGAVADLAGIRAAAAAGGAITVADATQAVGWLPLDATNFDVIVVGAYKWLMGPRGTSFMTVGEAMIDQLRPLYAGWYAGDKPWESIYGLPLRLASDARRFDVSPAWLSWVGTVPALELVEEIGVEAIHDHDVGLANELRAGLGLEASNSPIVSLELPADLEKQRLDGLVTAFRAGRLRVGFHLYNTSDEVAQVLEAVRGQG